VKLAPDSDGGDASVSNADLAGDEPAIGKRKRP
jgi:hypothetical protein